MAGACSCSAVFLGQEQYDEPCTSMGFRGIILLLGWRLDVNIRGSRALETIPGVECQSGCLIVSLVWIEDDENRCCTAEHPDAVLPGTDWPQITNPHTIDTEPRLMIHSVYSEARGDMQRFV